MGYASHGRTTNSAHTGLGLVGTWEGHQHVQPTANTCQTELTGLTFEIASASLFSRHYSASAGTRVSGRRIRLSIQASTLCVIHETEPGVWGSSSSLPICSRHGGTAARDVLRHTEILVGTSQW
jgi:hypothetical protein